MLGKTGLKNKLFHVAVDCILVILSGILALLIRFDFVWENVPAVYSVTMQERLPIQLGCTLLVFILMHMYRFIWDSVSLYDLPNMVLATVLANLLSHGVSIVFSLQLPFSIAFITLLLQLLLFVGERYAVRIAYTIRTLVRGKLWDGSERILVIGAGDAGRVLVREINSRQSRRGRVCCMVDDDERKKGTQFEGVPVLGTTKELTEIVRKQRISTIVLAIPSVSAKRQKEILDICRLTDCTLKKLPELYKLEEFGVHSASLRDIQLEDLLERETIQLNREAIRTFAEDKVILITGGGGSIGSEICRQIVAYRPKKLIILDIYENNAYEIQQELLRYSNLKTEIVVEIASVREQKKLDKIFAHHRPDVVFHAAAHKHVPLMENCPEEAVKNNVFGTYHTVLAAEKAGVKKFVMISTDKAVNPTNIMGVTKQICEMIVRSRRDSGTEFCAVRFGNVLGSNGSVVPLFQQQIREGGPVTITDKRVVRYFMLIPEAAQLVLEAGAMARQGEVFVLDMGEPVRILTLAENLIRLSGLEPYQDIDIQEIGLRPGEKLYEELLLANGNLSETENHKIFVEQKNNVSQARVENILQALSDALEGDSTKEQWEQLLHSLISSYRTPEQVNSEAILRQTAAEEEPMQAIS